MNEEEIGNYTLNSVMECTTVKHPMEFEEREVILEFPKNFHYRLKYTFTDMYCPFCGEQSIWENNDSFNCICQSCKGSFDITHRVPKLEAARLHVVRQLVAGVIITPSTPEKRGR